MGDAVKQAADAKRQLFELAAAGRQDGTMATVRIVYDSLFAAITLRQQESLAIGEETLQAVLLRLGEAYGERFRQSLFVPGGRDIRPEIVVLVNGRHGEPASALADGDEVVLLVPFAGG
jgi:molybdopterin converting factor small subunit